MERQSGRPVRHQTCFCEASLIQLPGIGISSVVAAVHHNTDILIPNTFPDPICASGHDGSFLFTHFTPLFWIFQPLSVMKSCLSLKTRSAFRVSRLFFVPTIWIFIHVLHIDHLKTILNQKLCRHAGSFDKRSGKRAVISLWYAIHFLYASSS